MIKFFRNLRMRMLAENRFSRYLIYAIGEIVLVVIGILIAVQVNDWNQNRKLSELSSSRLHKMILELESTKARMDRLTYNSAQEYSFGYPALDEATANCDSLLKLSYAGITNEHIDFILEARFFAGKASLNIQQDVFEEATSNGQLNALGSEKLVAAIKAYHARCVRESGYQLEYNEACRRGSIKFEDGFGKLLLDYKMNPSDFEIENYPWLFNHHSKEFQNMQIGMNVVNENQKESMEKMLEIYKLSDSLILMIQEELND